MEEDFDREYYIAAICDKFGSDNDVDVDAFFEAANKAIDKTLEQYKKNGKLLVEDWDMFDQDLYTNSYNELIKLE
jgi:hypothetical protein